MKRWLWNIAAALSLLLLLASLGMWLRSGFRYDALRVMSSDGMREVQIASGAGGLSYFVSGYKVASDLPSGTWSLPTGPGWLWNLPSYRRRVPDVPRSVMAFSVRAVLGAVLG